MSTKQERDQAVKERSRVMTGYSFLVEAEENISTALEAMQHSVEDELIENIRDLHQLIGSTLDDFNVPKR